MRVEKKGSFLEVDIHGMTENEAYKALIKLLDSTDVTEIHVIHGYIHGHTLKNMVQNKLVHPRILYKCPTLCNYGETKIYLKK